MSEYHYNTYYNQVTLHNYLDNILTGKCSPMPYFLKKIDVDGRPRIGFRCILCCKYCYDRLAIMKHILRHKYFFCQFCENKKFRQITKLHEHFKMYHSHEIAIKTLKCVYCYRSFTDIKSYTKHAPCIVQFKCVFCNFETDEEVSLDLHIKSCHFYREDDCLDCSLHYFKEHSLKEHMLRIKGKKFVCPSCGIVFHTKEFLDVHLQIFGSDHNCDMKQDIQISGEEEIIEKEGSGNVYTTITGGAIDPYLLTL